MGSVLISFVCNNQIRPLPFKIAVSTIKKIAMIIKTQNSRGGCKTLMANSLQILFIF